METLVVVAQHRNQYYSKVRSNGPAKFGTSPSRHFKDINCRTFQSGEGILPTPFQASTTTVTKITNHVPLISNSPKTPSPAMKSQLNSHRVDNGHFKTISKSSPITINVTVPRKETSFCEEIGLSDGLVRHIRILHHLVPLPIPKFSMRPPNRTVSLDLPVSHGTDFNMLPTAKSAPASPSREHSPCMGDLFLRADSATKTLRRILNLDLADE
ncbi:hypothetical protein OIU77_025883 [Salix suchowensis]|uniref:Uncharacterized protein n=1 Tax=Salix suchowensis TaxID=1278906 RepID=A0ABQ9BXS2_9ROSI|nr:hypothetical protein OIU77_025883 [Salix suchowensis]